MAHSNVFVKFFYKEGIGLDKRQRTESGILVWT